MYGDFLFRKRAKSEARYRFSPQSGLQGENAPPIVAPHDVNPAYDAREGSVKLDGSRAFENPMYKSLSAAQVKPDY